MVSTEGRSLTSHIHDNVVSRTLFVLRNIHCECLCNNCHGVDLKMLHVSLSKQIASQLRFRTYRRSEMRM